MKTSVLLWVLVAVVVVLGGWYWYASTQMQPTVTPAPQASDQAPNTNTSTQTTVTTTVVTHTPSATGSFGAYAPGNLLLGADSKAALGSYLIGSSGMTLYTYSPDTPNFSNCTGTCAQNWPPYTIPSTSVLSNVQAGIGGKVGSFTRADGTMQVTYNGAPLYFYIKDAKSSDTLGQGVGGIWYVVKP